MNKYGFCLLLSTLSFLAKGQSWRYSIEAGGSRSWPQVTSGPVISTGSAVTDEGRTGASGQLTIERSIERHLSLRLGLGISSNRLVRAFYPVALNADHQVTGFGGRSQEQVVVRPYMASVGIQANTNALKRIILTGALDATVSGNTGNFDKTVTGNSPIGNNHAVTYGQVSFPYSLPNLLVNTMPLVWGASLRVGADYRLTKNTYLTLSTAYHYSVNSLKQYTDQLVLSSISYPVTYTNTGNTLSFCLGLKRNITNEKPTEHYTPYNAPFQQTTFAQEEQNGFQGGKWFIGVAGGYWPGKLPQNLEYTSFLNGHASYTPLPRLRVGLLLENYWVRPANFSHIYNQWLSVGPFVRYHLTGGWLCPFIEVAYQLGQKRLVADYVQTYSSNFSTYTVRPGVSIWLQRHLWIDFALAIRSEQERHVFGVTLAAASSPSSPTNPPTPGIGSSPVARNPYNGPLPQLGLTYQFGR